MSVGADGVPPLRTSTGAVPWNSGTLPDSATIVTWSVSADAIRATCRSRSSAAESGGMFAVVSTSVSGGALERTTMNRTRSSVSPNEASALIGGRMGATATGARCSWGSIPSRHVANSRMTPRPARAVTARDNGAATARGTRGSELTPGPSGRQGCMFGPMRTARRTHGFTESVIRGMTRLATEHRAINLAQGFPNFPCPEILKEAAARAIHDDVNQYAITWGASRLRNALAAKYQDWYHMPVDPMTQVTVTCGATEAMASSLLGIVDPGDEVVVLEPFYENYGPDAILCDAKPVFVPMPSGESIDLDRLAKAFSAKTKAIIVCTPNNPTGRVLTRAELEAIAELCQRHDAFAVTDEIYEHIYYEGEHIPMATLPGMADRPDHRAARRDRRDPESARLSHRGRARAAAGSRRGRDRDVGGRLLRGARARLSAPARRPLRRPAEGGLHLSPTAGRLLRDGRLLRALDAAGRSVRQMVDRRTRRSAGARLELLLARRARAQRGAVRVL